MPLKQAKQHGFLLLNVCFLLTIWMVLLHSMVAQLLSLQHAIISKKEHIKAVLAAESGLRIAATVFENIPTVADGFTASDYYHLYQDGFVQTFHQTRISLFKTSTKIVSVYQNRQYRFGLESNYSQQGDELKISKLTQL